MHLHVGAISRGAAGDGFAESAALVLRIQQGDPAAEAELVHRYRDGLRLMLRRRLKEVARAEDLCHEVFGIALPALREGRLRDDRKLTGYLWGIARNLASHDRRLRIREGNALSDGIVDPSPDAEDRCARLERAALLRRALDELSIRDRAVLRGFYLADQSKDELCRRHALTPPQFDVIKHRALRRLAAAFDARGGDRV
jgi:RNA polymerase sigma-70 factor (ECF subfamily)